MRVKIIINAAKILGFTTHTNCKVEPGVLQEHKVATNYICVHEGSANLWD